jgi:hypothetical protein
MRPVHLAVLSMVLTPLPLQLLPQLDVLRFNLGDTLY